MNWVSYTEDIEELRQQNEHYQRGIDSLIRRLQGDASLKEIHRVEADLRKLADQLIRRYEDHKIEARKKFEEAIKFLSDPSLQVAKRLEKRIRERDEARAELERSKDELSRCRSSQARNLQKISQLGKEKIALQKDIESLKDEAFMKSELAGIQPLKGKK